MAKKDKEKKSDDPALEAFQKGMAILRDHPLFGHLFSMSVITTVRTKNNYCPENGWAVVVDNGQIHVHPSRRDTPEAWAFVVAHCILHLCFDHFKIRSNVVAWNAAACAGVNRFLTSLKVGQPPVELAFRPEVIPAKSEEVLYQDFCERGIPDDLKELSVGGKTPDLWLSHQKIVYSQYNPRKNWKDIFATALRKAVTSVLDDAGKAAQGGRPDTKGQKARAWFINNYPLLGALAASFEIIEDPEILKRMDISIGAVMAEAKEIYINTQKLNDAECIFVMAHEILHAALRHDERTRGRDHYLFNLACDFVINEWLIEMEIGQMPTFGLYRDPSLKGMSAEQIYDLMVTDMRRFRKLGTFRGVGLGDLMEKSSEWWRLSQDGVRLDEFYRQALSQGLIYHQEQNRGFLPAGLIEEIRALMQPPIPWDVELARWFDAYFQPLEKTRSFARPSRRQSSTPDIPRPSWVPKYPDDARTYGVVLDTSGSMDRTILAKALGAIASYSMSRDVPAARVIFCDAQAYDEGYMAPEDIAGRVRVKGRGGTVLQPGIDLLIKAADFPDKAPILIITDGFCENRLKIGRDHAYLLPQGNSLPFPPTGEVFRIS